MSSRRPLAPNRRVPGAAQPGPHDLVRDRQVLSRIGHRADAAGRLEARMAAMVPDCRDHDPRGFGRCVDRDFAGRGLDEVGAGLKGQNRGGADVVFGLEFAGFENDLEHLPVRYPRATLGDQTTCRAGVAGEQRAPGHDEIDFVGAVRKGGLDRGEDLSGIVVAAGEIGDRGDTHFGTVELSLRPGNEFGPDAHRGNRSERRLRAVAQILDGSRIRTVRQVRQVEQPQHA